MANHAKVITNNRLDPKEIDSIVQLLNKEKLGDVFKLTFVENNKKGYGKYQWELSFGEDNYLVFWLSDENEYGYINEAGEWIEYDKPKTINQQNCIEFRHGHWFNFMWWVEGIFRENLGKIFNAKMWDDGVGECGAANPQRYETYKTYASFHYIKNGVLDKESLKRWKEIHFDFQKDEIPKELIENFNLDFDVN